MDNLKQAAIELANAVDKLIEEGKKDQSVIASFPVGACLVRNVQQKARLVRELTDPQPIEFPICHPALNSQREG